MMPLATLYEWLLFLHVLAGMVWLGGAVFVAALGTLVVRRRDGEEVVRFSATLRRIGPAVLAPAPPAVVGFGVWLVVDSPAWAFSSGLARGSRSRSSERPSWAVRSTRHGPRCPWAPQPPGVTTTRCASCAAGPSARGCSRRCSSLSPGTWC